MSAATREDLLLVVRGLMLCAVGLAVWLGRRSSAHRPVAVFLGVQLGVMLGRWALKVWVLRAAVAAAGGDLDAGIAGAPLHGWALVAGVAYNAGWLAWPAGLATLSLWCFGRRSPQVLLMPTEEQVARWQRERRIWTETIWAPISLWVAAVAFIALSYPHGRPWYPNLFSAAELAAVLGSLAVAGRWLARAWGRESLGFARGCTLFLTGCGGVSLAGPYTYGIFSTWWLANAVQLVMYSGLILAHGGALWMVYRSR